MFAQQHSSAKSGLLTNEGNICEREVLFPLIKKAATLADCGF